MMALVTGATGFTGGMLALELCRRNRRVRALVRPGTDASKLEAAGVEIARGDIRDETAVRRAVAGCESIYHLAAVFRTAGHSRSFYSNVNVGGTANVIAAARHASISRLVHCSTVGVHGHVEKRFMPADEDAPLAPGDVYQRTKLEGERLVSNAIADGLPATIFRPGGIYGPGDLRFLKLFRSVNNGTFRMFGSGRVHYHLTYIDDLVEGIIRCGERTEALGRTYILAGPSHTTLDEVVAEIAHALGVPVPTGRLPMWPLRWAAAACEALCVPLGINPPLHRRRIEFFWMDRAFSIERARNELGYAPKVDLPEGLEKTANWYFENGYLRRSQATGQKPGGRPLTADT